VLRAEKEEDRETRRRGGRRSPARQAVRSRPSRRTREAAAKLRSVVVTEGRGSIDAC